MEKLTYFQKQFAVLALTKTIAFFILLNIFIPLKEWQYVTLFAISYGVLMFIQGLIHGYKDRKGQVIHDKGFRYHLLTFVIVNGVYLAFIAWPTTVFKLWPDCIGMLAWGIGLLIHYRVTRNNIQGYQPEELFE
jgi:low temperature requirement protein LtrA